MQPEIELMNQSKIFVLLALMALNVQDGFGQSKMLLEKLTATWCGWCPENDLELDAMVESVGEENVIVVQHHVMDAMSTDFGDQVAEEFINGTPALLFNRIKFEDQWNVAVTRTEWTEHLEPGMAMLEDKVNINSSHTYDADIRNLSIDIEMDFLVNLNGDYRVNCYIVEDNVSSPMIDFSQTNYWAGEDHELGDLPNPITSYKHKKVVREILGGPWGLPGVLNPTISAGENVNTLFFYTVPEGLDVEELSYVIIVQEYNEEKFERQILNAHEQMVNTDQASGIEDLNSSVKVFPNPVSDFLNIQSDVQINALQVFNARGQELYLMHDTNGIVVEDLASGWYIIQLHTDQGTIHHKFIKE